MLSELGPAGSRKATAKRRRRREAREARVCHERQRPPAPRRAEPPVRRPPAAGGGRERVAEHGAGGRRRRAEAPAAAAALRRRAGERRGGHLLPAPPPRLRLQRAVLRRVLAAAAREDGRRARPRAARLFERAAAEDLVLRPRQADGGGVARLLQRPRGRRGPAGDRGGHRSARPRRVAAPRARGDGRRGRALRRRLRQGRPFRRVPGRLHGPGRGDDPRQVRRRRLLLLRAALLGDARVVVEQAAPGRRLARVPRRDHRAVALPAVPEPPAGPRLQEAHAPRRGRGRTRERNSQLQRLISRPFSTRFG